MTVWTEGRTCTISSLTQLLPIQCFTNHEQVLLWQYPFISGVRAPSRPRPGVVSQLFFSFFGGGEAFIFFPDMRGLEFGERWCEVGLFHLFQCPLLGRRIVGRVPCCDRRWERRVAAHGSHPVYFSFSIDGSS